MPIKSFHSNILRVPTETDWTKLSVEASNIFYQMGMGRTPFKQCVFQTQIKGGIFIKIEIRNDISKFEVKIAISSCEVRLEFAITMHIGGYTHSLKIEYYRVSKYTTNVSGLMPLDSPLKPILSSHPDFFKLLLCHIESKVDRTLLCNQLREKFGIKIY